MYFLASSFTDFWRRINIYWKDFMMKVFYYPALLRVRKRGEHHARWSRPRSGLRRTWALHAYQMFWIRGSYTFTWNDPLFWTILCGLVTINALAEAKFGRRRALSGESRDWRAGAFIALKTAGNLHGDLCAVELLEQRIARILVLALAGSALLMPSPAQAATFAFVVAGVVLCLATLLAWNAWVAPLINRQFEWRVGLVLAELFLLNAISISAIYLRLGLGGPTCRVGPLRGTERQ